MASRTGRPRSARRKCIGELFGKVLERVRHGGAGDKVRNKGRHKPPRLRDVNSHLAQCSRRPRIFFAQEAGQEMFRPNVRDTKTFSLLRAECQGALGCVTERKVAGRSLRAFGVCESLTQHTGRLVRFEEMPHEIGVRFEQAEKQVLGLDAGAARP